ncbi:MAG: outer membrane beta-barrel protein [Acidobacteriota bacterium]
MYRCLILFASVAALHAQPLTYGFKLGVPFSDESHISPNSTNTQSRWTGGPFIELHLPYRLGVEFSALARTSRENSTMSFPLGSTQNPYLVSITDKVKTWDFPLLLKYRFTEGKFRPYIGAGGAWSHRRSGFQTVYSCMGPQGSCKPPEFPYEIYGGQSKSTLTKFGPAASAGLDIKTQYVTISPEIRWIEHFQAGRRGINSWWEWASGSDAETHSGGKGRKIAFPPLPPLARAGPWAVVR